jgi:hypothetical protein
MPYKSGATTQYGCRVAWVLQVAWFAVYPLSADLQISLDMFYDELWVVLLGSNFEFDITPKLNTCSFFPGRKY